MIVCKHDARPSLSLGVLRVGLSEATDFGDSSSADFSMLGGRIVKSILPECETFDQF